MLFIVHLGSKLIPLTLDITRTDSSGSESFNKIFCNNFGLYKIVERYFSGIFFVLIGMLVDPANILPTLPVALRISIISTVKFSGDFIPLYLKEAHIYDAITGGICPLPKGKVVMITTTLMTTLLARSIDIR